eukprot:COSAG01_NODE_25490_length_743_cov_1.170807_1_plen_111_part_10
MTRTRSSPNLERYDGEAAGAESALASSSTGAVAPPAGPPAPPTAAAAPRAAGLPPPAAPTRVGEGDSPADEARPRALPSPSRDRATSASTGEDGVGEFVARGLLPGRASCR